MLQQSFAEFEQSAADNQTNLEMLLSNQQASFQSWFDNLQSKLDENQASNLQNQITKLKADQETFAITHGLKSYPLVIVTAWDDGFDMTALGETGWIGGIPETIPSVITYPSWNEVIVKVPIGYKMINPSITETEPYNYLLVEGSKSLRLKLIGGNEE